MEDTRFRQPARPFNLGRSLIAKMESSYKVDEGYSEETRSQEGMDEAMRIDTGDEGAIFDQFPLSVGLQDAVLALGENERRGKFLSLAKAER